MIIEDYVSFEIAKLLKEKGFNEICEMFYCKPHEGYLKNHKRDEWRNSDLRKDMTCTCPTHQMTMKWLREIHNINITIIPTRQEKLVVGGGFVREYCSNIYNDNNIIHVLEFITGYEKACEAAIKYCLENLI